MARHYFTGFSTMDSHTSRERTFYDTELVKRDLINHFHTKVGERVMRPTWGCRIWDYMMEPFTDFLRDKIVAEAIAICDADTRVKIVAVDANETTHGLTVSITLDYHPMDVIETFSVDFERREDARWGGNLT